MRPGRQNLSIVSFQQTILTNYATVLATSICDDERQEKTKSFFDTITFLAKHHLETRDICSFINKIYSNKLMAANST